MAKLKGTPKTGGRVKGTPNKNTVAVRELLDKLGCNPIEGMAKIAMDENQPIELRAKMFSDLAQYSHPKRKAIEISGPDGSPIPIESADVPARQRLADGIARLRERLGSPGGN